MKNINGNLQIPSSGKKEKVMLKTLLGVCVMCMFLMPSVAMSSTSVSDEPNAEGDGIKVIAPEVVKMPDRVIAGCFYPCYGGEDLPFGFGGGW